MILSPSNPLNRSLFFTIVLIASLLNISQSFGEVTLAPIFGDNIVLPYGKKVPIWGQATPGETVRITFSNQQHQTQADQQGNWSVSLEPLLVSSAPKELLVEGSTRQLINNVVVGEVWLCSGQSNMAWNISQLGLAEDVSPLANDPLLRQFFVPKAPVSEPSNKINGEWKSASSDTVLGFSAVAYFFAVELRRELNMPIGLVNSSYGGTQIEAWISAPALALSAHQEAVDKRWQLRLKDYPADLKQHEAKLETWNQKRIDAQANGQKFTEREPRMPEGLGSRKEPSTLFNGMIHPLVPFPFTGVIWYQGESNAPRHSEYAELFKEMILQWRQDFRDADLPFYFVQLANMERNPEIDPTARSWAFLREAQAAALDLPQVGMAVTYDIGEPNNIHPKNKLDVGKRLSLLALEHIHNRDVVSTGPRYRHSKRVDEGFRVYFDNADGLSSTSSKFMGFEVAGADRVFIPAEAMIDGQTVIVSTGSMEGPLYLRYNWRNNPITHFYNSANLPAEPFRTDN